MVVVENLQKIYGETLAVDGLTFSLSSGQICGLVGPNGAGKTTTMRSLAGLVDPTYGTLSVAGFSVEREPLQVRRVLAYIPDDPPLFDDLSVGQHLDFIGRVYQVENHRSIGMGLLREFNLEEKLGAPARSLSRGMRQKLAVCCAYLYSPSVILLDEPLTGLDPPGIRKLLESLQLRASDGATIIISSHLLAVIQDVCDHLLVMQKGQRKYFGKTENLRRRFPDVRSLEEAYFCATCDDALDPLPLQTDLACPASGDVAGRA